MKTMIFRRTAATAVLLGVLGATTPAFASLTASELALDSAVFDQFNAVTFGDYTANNESEGRIAVGGNFIGGSGGHNICFNGCSGDTTDPALGATYGALNVWGNVSGSGAKPGADAFIQGTNGAGSTLNMNQHGGVSIVGANSGAIQGATFVSTSQASAGTVQNAPSGATVSTNQPAASVFPFPASMPFAGALANLAASLQSIAAATTAQNLGHYVQNGATGIAATAAPGSYGGKSYGFITTTMSDLASYQNFSGIDASGVDAAFVIVTGNSTSALPNLNTFENNVIWDFVDATTVNFAGAWQGQILAPNATVTNGSGDLNGTVIAQSVNQSNEYHYGNNALPSGALSGLPVSPSSPTSVDEPSTLAVFVAAVALLAGTRRRRAAARL